MLFHTVTMALRALGRHRQYLVTNVAGLGVAFAFALLAFVYLRHEWGWDACHPRADALYRVAATATRSGTTAMWSTVPPALAPAAHEQIPEVANAVRLGGRRLDQLGPADNCVQCGSESSVADLTFADPALLEVLSFPLLAGDAATALARPDGVVLSEEMARRCFPQGDALGRSLPLRSAWSDQWYPFVVTGVARRIPPNSTVRFDILVPYVRLPDLAASHLDPGRWDNWGSLTYLQLDPGAPADEVGRKLNLLARSRGAVAGDWDSELSLQPLRDTHLSRHPPNPRIPGIQPESDPRYSYALLGLVALVLAIAGITFANLAAARAVDRVREMGVRQALGAQKWQRVGHVWAEALVVTVLALVVGLAMAKALLPAFGHLAGRELSQRLGWELAAAAVALGLGASLAGSLGPALGLSRWRAAAMRGQMRVPGSGRLGRGLLVVQLALAVFLVILAAAMLRQVRFVQHRDLGLRAEDVVLIHMDDLAEYGPRSGGHAALRNALVAHSGVRAAAMLRYPLWVRGGLRQDDLRLPGGTLLEAQTYMVGYGVVEALGMRVLAGRDLARDTPGDVGRSVLVNRTFAERLGGAAAVGARVELANAEPAAGSWTIVGVVEDFHLESLHHRVEPTVLMLNPELAEGREDGRLLAVRLDPGQSSAVLALAAVQWRRVAGADVPLRYSFLDEDLARFYHEDRRWTRIVTWGSGLAVLLACLGALSLASLAAARRRREIGIRKAVGASALRIVRLLCAGYALRVGLAGLLACPAAYLAAERWLDGFAYRVEPTLGLLAAGVGVTLAAVLLAVGSQALRAAWANPVDALRHE
ncbi:MAG: ABC transporter permease [Candidatus Latescibacterota bacterium]